MVVQMSWLWVYDRICCHLQEEIDIEAKVLRAGKAIGVAVVELKKKSGKIIAQARYSKYLGASSKLWTCNPCVVSCNFPYLQVPVHGAPKKKRNRIAKYFGRNN